MDGRWAVDLWWQRLSQDNANHQESMDCLLMRQCSLDCPPPNSGKKRGGALYLLLGIRPSIDGHIVWVWHGSPQCWHFLFSLNFYWQCVSLPIVSNWYRAFNACADCLWWLPLSILKLQFTLICTLVWWFKLGLSLVRRVSFMCVLALVSTRASALPPTFIKLWSCM